MARSTETPTLSITFSFDPGTNLFSALMENGARFSFSGQNVNGKLGANLELFAQGVRAIIPDRKGKTTTTANGIAPLYREDQVVKVAPGRAYGVSTELDKIERARKNHAHERALQDALENLEIEL